ncbi:AAA family ATPase [Candidatus Dependentiae bacterium]|nr:AAA family ATPase [Candidatus Dependentiae bacterium]
MNYTKFIAAITCLNLWSFSSFAMDETSWSKLAQLIAIRQEQQKAQASIGSTSVGSFCSEAPKKTFSDMVGEIPEEIRCLIKYITNPQLYKSVGLGSLSAEILLEGPPGTGKTTLAEAIASALNRNIYKLSCTSFITGYQASGSERVAALFDKIRTDNSPVVVFIDEIDGLANTEISDRSGEVSRTVFELQRQLDRKDPLVVCVLATNNLGKMPAALKDRFAHNTITLGLPDFDKRLALIKYYTQDKPFKLDKQDYVNIALCTEGLSCRVIENILKKALLMALDKHDGETKFKIPCKTVYIALYLAQNVKVPTYLVRKMLFKYYMNKLGYSADEKLLHFLAEKSEGFDNSLIKLIIENAQALCHACMNKKCSEEDFYVSFYSSQTVHCPNSEMKSEILIYYVLLRINEFVGFIKAFSNQQLVNALYCLAQEMVDDFTGNELKEVIDYAIENKQKRKADFVNIADFYIGFYKKLLDKAKPYTLTCSTTRSKGIKFNYKNKPYLNEEVTFVEEATALHEKAPFLATNMKSNSESATGRNNYTKSSTLDYRNSYTPSTLMINYLLEYFLEPTNVKLNSEIKVAFCTHLRSQSCYSIKKVLEKLVSAIQVQGKTYVGSRELIAAASEANVVLKNTDILIEKPAVVAVKQESSSCVIS